MKEFCFTMLTFVKKFIDKLYYSKYTRSRETLIREVFPWINYIWDYSTVELFLKSSNPTAVSDLIKVITTFYWWEVNRLTIQNDFQWIVRYQGLLDFCQSLRDYQEYILEENKK